MDLFCCGRRAAPGRPLFPDQRPLGTPAVVQNGPTQSTIRTAQKHDGPSKRKERAPVLCSSSDDEPDETPVDKFRCVVRNLLTVQSLSESTLQGTNPDAKKKKIHHSVKCSESRRSIDETDVLTIPVFARVRVQVTFKSSLVFHIRFSHDKSTTWKPQLQNASVTLGGCLRMFLIFLGHIAEHRWSFSSRRARNGKRPATHGPLTHCGNRFHVLCDMLVCHWAKL